MYRAHDRKSEIIAYWDNGRNSERVAKFLAKLSEACWFIARLSNFLLHAGCKGLSFNFVSLF